jgi:hypothetical protein
VRCRSKCDRRNEQAEFEFLEKHRHSDNVVLVEGREANNESSAAYNWSEATILAGQSLPQQSIFDVVPIKKAWQRLRRLE